MAHWLITLIICFSAFDFAMASTDQCSQILVSSELDMIKDKLSIKHKGQILAVKIRSATLSEVEKLFLSDETGEPEIYTQATWNENPESYYRWDLTSIGEVGIISDIAKEVAQYSFSVGGNVDPLVMPKVVVATIDGQERIVAVGTFNGDVKIHADYELRKHGTQGLGKAILAGYLIWALETGHAVSFASVNNSFRFYEKLGFMYSDDKTPATVPDASVERFNMHLPKEKILPTLRKIVEASGAS